MTNNLLGKVKRFLRADDGPTAIEYMVMISIVVIFCLMTINVVGNLIGGSFADSSQSISDAFNN